MHVLCHRVVRGGDGDGQCVVAGLLERCHALCKRGCRGRCAVAAATKRGFGGEVCIRQERVHVPEV